MVHFRKFVKQKVKEGFVKLMPQWKDQHMKDIVRYEIAAESSYRSDQAAAKEKEANQIPGVLCICGLLHLIVLVRLPDI